MAIPRSELIDESCAGFYHCMSRTVRQGFLLSRHSSDATPDGLRIVDDHRREWIVNRLELLSTAFAIDCFSVAVMGNHLHLLLRNLPELVEVWSDAEVVYRWLLIHRSKTSRKRLGIPLDAPPTQVELLRFLANPKEVDRLRARLSSISWFMKELKEHVARRANREENRTGAFWEERFKSVRVLDDAGLMAVAAYIDLNPVRAGMVDDPLRARFTSLELFLRRLEREASSATLGAASEGERNRWNHSFDDANGQRRGLEFWRRIAGAPDAGAGATMDPAPSANDRAVSGTELEAFIAQFDSALFTAALPARREPYGIGEAWAPASGELGRTAAPVETATMRNPRLGDELNARAGRSATETTAESSVSNHTSESRCESSDVTDVPPGHEFSPRVPRHPPRRIPTPTPLAISMGDYFRRLLILNTIENSANPVRSGDVRPHDGRDVMAVRALATDLTGLVGDEAIDALGRILRAEHSVGTAIGTRTSLAAEATRRQRSRVVAVNRPDV